MIKEPLDYQSFPKRSGTTIPGHRPIHLAIGLCAALASPVISIPYWLSYFGIFEIAQYLSANSLKAVFFWIFLFGITSLVGPFVAFLCLVRNGRDLGWIALSFLPWLDAALFALAGILYDAHHPSGIRG
ncbi:MAG: hypothetical protein ACTHLN_07490 [Tepidisphaeraceae bacterium]